MSAREEEWLFGWDETPGIVSVWAESDGRAWIFRRSGPELVCERARFRPFVVVDSLTYLEHLGPRLRPENEGAAKGTVTYEELEGEGALRYVIRSDDGRQLEQQIVRGARRALARDFASLRELGGTRVIALPPEEQYLVATGRTYFRDLTHRDLRRLAFDLETTGLDPECDRIFMAAICTPSEKPEVLELAGDDDAAEAELLRALAERIHHHDPDVIENHNLHGFDLPFLARRAEKLRLNLRLGRLPERGFGRRPSARGSRLSSDDSDDEFAIERRTRLTLAGRELIDSMDLVRRHDFAARDLPGHGLKAVARHLGVAREQRELVPGAHVYEEYRRDPARVRRYATEDAREAREVARILGGATFALARMVPRRYERLADAGPATGVLDPLLVRAYLREKRALAAPQPGDGTPHSGAALHLFATGVAARVVKADVASLYPSLMREYRIGPARDRLHVLLSLVDRLVEQRLAAKARARSEPVGSESRLSDEAIAAAMKIVVNSAYGYLGAAGLTRFSDVHAANEVTRRGRALLALLCRELAARGVILLEADTDGVYFAVPESFRESDERRVVGEVAALLPSRVQLEFEGRYAAMLSHEPKNYALLGYDDALTLRGVAFRSRRAEPYGEQFLRRALDKVLRGDVAGVRTAYVETVAALRRRALPTSALASEVRLTKSPDEYRSTREERRELAYEAVLGSGRTRWLRGERVRVYRASQGRPALLPEARSASDAEPARDYDVEYYVKLLRETFASRLARALSPEDYASVFADPSQLDLFERSLGAARPILTILSSAPPERDDP